MQNSDISGFSDPSGTSTHFERKIATIFQCFAEPWRKDEQITQIFIFIFSAVFHVRDLLQVFHQGGQPQGPSGHPLWRQEPPLSPLRTLLQVELQSEVAHLGCAQQPGIHLSSLREAIQGEQVVIWWKGPTLGTSIGTLVRFMHMKIKTKISR